MRRPREPFIDGLADGVVLGVRGGWGWFNPDLARREGVGLVQGAIEIAGVLVELVWNRDELSVGWVIGD